MNYASLDESGYDQGRRQRGSKRRQIITAIVLLLVVVMGGTTGYMLIEGWGFWRSFFFVLISITTVGYHAEGLSTSGEQFTALLLIGGISTATYAFGVIVQASILAQLSWRLKMHRQIRRLKEHFIVCGFGRIGRPVCERLEAAGHDVVVIEGDQNALEEARERGFLAIRGNATEDEVLLEAGVGRAKGIVCAVNSDADNIVIALGARELRPDIQIVARVDEDGATRKIQRAGADHVVSPFRTAAMDIANGILQPNVTGFLSQANHTDGGFELSEVTVDVGSRGDGRSIAALRRQGSAELVFVAIKRVDGTTNLGPTDVERVAGGDVIIVAGPPLAVRRISSMVAGDRAKGKPARARRELTSWGPLLPPEVS